MLTGKSSWHFLGSLFFFWSIPHILKKGPTVELWSYTLFPQLFLFSPHGFSVQDTQHDRNDGGPPVPKFAAPLPPEAAPSRRAVRLRQAVGALGAPWPLQNGGPRIGALRPTSELAVATWLTWPMAQCWTLHRPVEANLSLLRELSFNGIFENSANAAEIVLRRLTSSVMRQRFPSEDLRQSLPPSLRVLAEDHKGDAVTWTIWVFFPQQRKLKGSSAQISSGVFRCGSQEQVPEAGSGRFWRVPVCAGFGSGGRFGRFRRVGVCAGDFGEFRCVLV